ncbi:MAG: family 20 glycosylhydrolase [Candidatus Izemoplasmatales bacterium]
MKNIIPVPKRYEVREGHASCAGGFSRRGFEPPFEDLAGFVEEWFPHRQGRRVDAGLELSLDPTIGPEAYRIEVDPRTVRIVASGRRGAFYALQTLRQLVDPRSGRIPCVAIADEPDLPLRGFMMDVSRDKIPTMATVERFVDALAMVKMNHFELYVEGFSYAYPSFPEVWKDETPFTPSEYEELDAYCAAREIDFVPCQNGFGHMSAWLARPEYHPLAECEEGFVAWGFPFPASTLNPLDPGSLELVKKLYADMLPRTTSNYFNLCGDEPFELGQGKSKAVCDTRGREAVYVDFIDLLCAEAARYGKTPMLWGDVLVNHPEAAAKLPKDAVFIDWGYDRGYPFEPHAEAIAKTGLKLVAAPGTSSWNSFASRRGDMIDTTRRAAAAMKRYGGLGILQTDWGDFGHLQYLPFSWPGMLHAAGVAWGEAPSETAVIRHIDRHLAPEGKGRLGRCILDLSTYPSLEKDYVYNGTTAFRSIMFIDPAPGRDASTKRTILAGALAGSAYGAESAKDVFELIDFVDRAAREAPPSIVRDEIIATCGWIAAAVSANVALTDPERGAKATAAAVDFLARVLPEHERLWRSRNREGGLDRSLVRPRALKMILEESQPL